MVASYAYYSAKNELNSPIPEAAVIVPSDTEDMFVVYRSIYVGSDTGLGSSDVRLITDGGTTLTFKNVPHGKILPVTARRVLATGTTATLILGLGQGIPGFVLSPNGFPAQLDLDFVNNISWDGNQVSTPAALLTCTRASDGYYQNADGTLKNGFGNNVIRTGSNGLLVEEARTNLAFQSQNVAVWTTSNGTVTGNTTLAPDGTLTAGTYIEDTSTSLHNCGFLNGIATSNGVTYTMSMYAKSNNIARPWIFLQFTDNVLGNMNAYYNLSGAGSLGTITGSANWTAVSATITLLANGWYRITLTGTTATGEPSGTPFFSTATGNGVNNFTGDGVSGFFVWGAQFEVGSFATSYIPTTTTSVTRASDTITCPITAYSFVNGTLYTNFTSVAVNSTSSWGIVCTNINNGNFAYENAGTTQLSYFDNTQAHGYNVTMANNTRYATALSWSAAGASTLSAINGVTTTDAPPTGRYGSLGATSLSFGDAFSQGHAVGSQYIKRVAFWNTNLSLATITTLTTTP